MTRKAESQHSESYPRRIRVLSGHAVGLPRSALTYPSRSIRVTRHPVRVDLSESLITLSESIRVDLSESLATALSATKEGRESADADRDRERRGVSLGLTRNPN